ncbi:DUF4209 domain-containing protein [Pseudomonas sp. IAP-CY TE4608]
MEDLSRSMATDQQPSVLELATEADFAQTMIGSLLKTIDTLEFYSIDAQFSALSRQALAEENHAAHRAYRVLMVVCSFHFSVDRQDAYGPRLIRDGMRTPIPSDIAGEQSQVLAAIAGNIDHPLLRARVADVAWYNHRNLQQSAGLAIESYCNAIEFYLDDKLSYRYDPPSGLSSRIIDFIERAFHIAWSTGKRKALPIVASSIWKRLYTQAQNLQCYQSFDRLARLGHSFKLIDWLQIAHDAEQSGNQAEPNHYAMAVKAVWELAAFAYRQSNDQEGYKRCKLKSIEQILKMREGVDSNLSRASWTRDAIQQLRSIPGMKSELEAMKVELLEQQAQAAHELSVFQIPMDVDEERQGTISFYKNLTLPDFFYRLALLCQVPEKMALHAEIIGDRSDSLLTDLLNGRVYTDALGRVIAQAPTINLNETPPAQWYDHESLRYLDIHYQMEVESRIKPAAQTLMSKFAVDDRHLMIIASTSPFVPSGFEHIYALGLARFLQGDMISACHLLFPQIENSLRHVLSNAGVETSKIDEEMLQEDRTMSGLLKHRRDQIESIFGADLIYMIDLLFNLKGGPSLRHELAHGKLTSSACYLHSSIYACWLIYHLVCVPLLPHWKTHMAPQLEQIAL